MPAMRLVLVALVLSTSGCAALFRSHSQDVAFLSEPPGAQVEVAAGHPTWCRTPCRISLRRSNVPTPYRIVMTGLEPAAGELIPASQWPGFWMLLVVLDQIWFPLGLIDFGPASYEYPERIEVVLPPEGTPARVTVIRQADRY